MAASRAQRPRLLVSRFALELPAALLDRIVQESGHRDKWKAGWRRTNDALVAAIERGMHVEHGPTWEERLAEADREARRLRMKRNQLAAEEAAKP